MPALPIQAESDASKFKHGVRLKCPQCKNIFSSNLKLAFDDHVYREISPTAFTHPLDAAALAALRKVPGLDFVCSKMMKYGYEAQMRVNSMGNNVKVSPKTFGYIYDMVSQTAKCLDVGVPDAFIMQTPTVNAFTVGTEYPLIIIHSGLLGLLTDDEVYAVIAHEVGHIKCQHVLYRQVATFLATVGLGLGLIANAAVYPVLIALVAWVRQSELSADRAALLVTNNKRSMVNLFMKLAGGSVRLASLIDYEEFLSQGVQFEKLTEGLGFNKLVKVGLNLNQDHPFSVFRAAQIASWADSEDYAATRRGNYEQRSDVLRLEFRVYCMLCLARRARDVEFW